MDSLVIANLFLLLFLGLADNQMIAALLPSLVKSLGITISRAGLLVVVYSLAAAIAAFLSGTLSDHYGRRKFLLAGVAFFAVASFAASESHSFNELMLARAFTGLAAGTLSTCSVTFAADWFPYNVRGRAIGLISTAYFAAPILGVPIAAQITDHFGWQRAFLFFAGLAVITAIATLRLPAERLNPRPSAEIMQNTTRAFRTFLTRRDTAAALVIAFLVSGGLVGFITYIGAWLNGRFGLSTGTIGWVFVLSGIVSIGSAPLGGILSDRWGKRGISIMSNIVLAAAIALVPFSPWGLGLLAVFALASLGAAFRQGPLTALMTEMVPAPQRGSFIAMRNISSQMGIGATAYIGGILFQRSGYTAVTMLCAVMTAIVAILLATHIVEPRGEPVVAVETK